MEKNVPMGTRKQKTHTSCQYGCRHTAYFSVYGEITNAGYRGVSRAKDSQLSGDAFGMLFPFSWYDMSHVVVEGWDKK